MLEVLEGLNPGVASWLKDNCDMDTLAELNNLLEIMVQIDQKLTIFNGNFDMGSIADEMEDVLNNTENTDDILLNIKHCIKKHVTKQLSLDGFEFSPEVPFSILSDGLIALSYIGCAEKNYTDEILKLMEDKETDNIEKISEILRTISTYSLEEIIDSIEDVTDEFMTRLKNSLVKQEDSNIKFQLDIYTKYIEYKDFVIKIGYEEKDTTLSSEFVRLFLLKTMRNDSSSSDINIDLESLNKELSYFLSCIKDFDLSKNVNPFVITYGFIISLCVSNFRDLKDKLDLINIEYFTNKQLDIELVSERLFTLVSKYQDR